MKKLFACFLALAFISISFAATTPVPGVNPVTPKASEVFVPIGNDGQIISLLDLSVISTKELATLTGKKLSIADKVGFKLAQKQLRQSINSDGTFNNKKMKKLLAKADGSGFHLGGFALGFLVGLIGVLIAYLINDEMKSQRVKWAWIGLGAAVLLYILIFALII